MKTTTIKSSDLKSSGYTTGLPLLLIILVISIPAVVGLFEDPQRREQWEKRKLAKLPDIIHILEQPKKFIAELDDYLNDHFGLSLVLNKAYRISLYYLFNVTPAKNITLNKDGFIYLNSHFQDKKNAVFDYFCDERKYPDEYFENTRKKFGTVEAIYRRKGYRFAMGLAPTKPVIYPDRLPESVPKRYREACSNYSNSNFGLINIINKLGRDGSAIYYPFDLFFKHKDDEYFFPKESFHWIGRSAHLFSAALLRLMGIHVTDVYDRDAVIKDDKSDLSSILGFSVRNKVWHYSYAQYGVELLSSLPSYTSHYYEHVNDYSHYRSKTPMSHRRAIVLSDSFGHSAASHLAPAYSELLHINITNLQEDEKNKFYNEFVDRFKPDDVIVIFHDAGIRNIEDIARVLSGE